MRRESLFGIAIFAVGVVALIEADKLMERVGLGEPVDMQMYCVSALGAMLVGAGVSTPFARASRVVMIAIASPLIGLAGLLGYTFFIYWWVGAFD
jgi:hypothetical protein